MTQIRIRYQESRPLPSPSVKAKEPVITAELVLCGILSFVIGFIILLMIATL